MSDSKLSFRIIDLIVDISYIEDVNPFTSLNNIKCDQNLAISTKKMLMMERWLWLIEQQQR